MKVLLTKEETVQATIMYLKSKGLVSPELDFIGTVSSYDDSKFLTITEFKPEVVKTEGDE